jgi:excisionase family DNA binding protein
MSDEFLTTPELSERINVPVATLHAWAFNGTGPTYYRLGRGRRYRWSDVEQWLETRRRSSSAGTGRAGD